MVKNFYPAAPSVILLSCLGLGAPAGVASAADASTDLTAARQAVSAAIAAEARAMAEYERLRQNGSLAPAELDDYRTFLTRLDRIVRENCRAVLRIKARTGDTSGEPNCERGATAEQLPLSFPNEQTEGERTATLERRLGASLSDFDEMLLREMEQLAHTKSASPDAGRGSELATGEHPGSDEAEEGGSRRGETPGDETRTATGSDKAASEGSSDRAVTAPGRETGQTAKVDHAGVKKDGKRSGAVVRDDVPDAGDDDVVARQLREAAENETDPELREKLWEEYKRYKSGKAQAR